MKEHMTSILYPLLLKGVMSHGKKRKAEGVLLKSFEYLRKHWKVNPVKTLELALLNASPAVRLQTRRRGSQRIRVPVPLNVRQRNSQGIRLICSVVRKKGGGSTRPASFRLAQELFLASQGQGDAFHKAQHINKEGVNNQANSHLRWF